MPHPAYQPSEPPPGDAVLAGQDQHQAAAELLTLTWQFLTQADPAVREQLRIFLTRHGYHPAAGPGAFLDGLQFTAAQLAPAHARQDPPRGT